MNIKYYDDNDFTINKNSIFLAGPTDSKNWHKDALELLKKYNFDGDVYVPEFRDKTKKIDKNFAIEWQLKYMDNASKVLYHIPENSKSDNVEFGYLLKNGNLIYSNEKENLMLDTLYKNEYNKVPYNNLESAINECVSSLNSSKEQQVFFTSDTHFGAERTRQFSFRPYKNVNDMDKDFIKKWNSKISPNDIVYHLGDFGNFDMVNKLNGKIVLILGNYEKKDLKDNFNNDFQKYENYLKEKGFAKIVKNGAYINLDNEKVYMTHEPLDCKKDVFNLFGHIHEKCKCKEFGLNVGIDCSNYQPLSLNEVLFLKNAIQNHYDNNVFCGKGDLKSCSFFEKKRTKETSKILGTSFDSNI